MARTINQVQLTGRLGRDPEFMITKTASKTHITKFSIATERYMGPDRPMETDWHNIVCFNKVADASFNNLHVGDQVQISGHLHQSQWTPEGGGYGSRTEVYANNVTFLRTKMPMAPAAASEMPEAAPVEMPDRELVTA